MSSPSPSSRWIWTSVKILLVGLLAAFAWYLRRKYHRKQALVEVSRVWPNGIIQLEVDQEAFVEKHKEEIDAATQRIASADRHAVLADFNERFHLHPRSAP